ncbi:MAG: transglutaminase domain-containing protein [Candidatus Bathyarchaeota archaeon]|nr:transglutaminase domain-containing protein [Candidatus Bathyarchaeota archaeon]
MKKYARLAGLLIVLTLSVGMLSTAINILGDIKRLDLDEDKPGPAVQMMNPGSLGKSDEVMEVGGSEPRKLGPIMEIRLATDTSYLRRMPAENYTSGTWFPKTSDDHIPFEDALLQDQYDEHNVIAFRQFYVTPLTNFKDNFPVAPNTLGISFNGSLVYSPELRSFSSPEFFQEPYWVSHVLLRESSGALVTAEPLGSEAMLQVPTRIKSQLRGLAEDITQGIESPYLQLRAIETHVNENYEFSEEFAPAPITVDPVSWFLFNDRRGVGTHFNSAVVLLARSIGIPCRAVIGYLIDPYSEVQYVMSQQVYLYVEAEFEDMGWITFDAAPRPTMEGDVDITPEQTFTNITGNDPVALKGKTFNVWGTVTNINGTPVSGPQVEIMLKANKTDPHETPLIVGVGFAEEGLFNVTCDAPTDLDVGDYNLIAHTLENRWYLESFSDPPIIVMAETTVKITGPRKVYSGKNITYRGVIVDASNGEPVSNITLNVEVLGKYQALVSNKDGRVSYETLFPENGDFNVTLEMPGTRFYVASAASYAVTVIPAPPSANKLFMLIFGFPNNIIIALGVAVGVGVFAARRNRRLKEEDFTAPRVTLAPQKEVIGWEDGVPLNYNSYEEGVVKLFNRFYVSMNRIYPDIDETMTPREFEYLLMDRLPDNSHAALEDLITSYEIAMYSNIPITIEDFKRTNATIELIIELMKNGQ